MVLYASTSHDYVLSNHTNPAPRSIITNHKQKILTLSHSLTHSIHKAFGNFIIRLTLVVKVRSVRDPPSVSVVYPSHPVPVTSNVINYTPIQESTNVVFFIIPLNQCSHAVLPISPFWFRPFPMPFLPPLRAKRLPMFPKQTQEQNNTLRIQIPPSRLSLLTYIPKPPRPWDVWCCCVLFLTYEEAAGEGIISGLDNKSAADPKDPTKTESTNPGLERSMIYHRTGFTNAKVREACRVDVQGSFLCKLLVDLTR